MRAAVVAVGDEPGAMRRLAGCEPEVECELCCVLKSISRFGSASSHHRLRRSHSRTLPTILIDVLLAANVAVAILVLLTTIYIRTPLEFSVFPTLLVATTLARLC